MLKKPSLLLLVLTLSSGCAALLQEEAGDAQVQPRTGVWEFSAIDKEGAAWKKFSGGETTLQFRLTFDAGHGLVAEAVEPTKTEPAFAGPGNGFQLFQSRPAWARVGRSFTVNASSGYWRDGRCGFTVQSEPAAIGTGQSYRAEFQLAVLSEAALKGGVSLLSVTAQETQQRPQVVPTFDPVQSSAFQYDPARPQGAGASAKIESADERIAGHWVR